MAIARILVGFTEGKSCHSRVRGNDKQGKPEPSLFQPARLMAKRTLFLAITINLFRKPAFFSSPIQPMVHERART
jgi:hypothetical protein